MEHADAKFDGERVMNPIDKIMIGVGAFVALVIAILVLWLCLANAHLRADLAEARANDTACHLANDEFRQKTEQQSRAIAALKTESETQQGRAALAVTAAEKTAAAFRAAATRIARQSSSGDDCKASAALFNRYIAGMK